MTVETMPIDLIIADFRHAVASDSLGMFCHEHGLGRMEWQADSSVHLIALIASHLAGIKRRGTE